MTSISRLVAFLLIACAAPLIHAVLPFNVYWMPVNWAASAVPVGAVLTLSFWVGLGNWSVLSRLIWGLLGATYAACWTSAAVLLVELVHAPSGTIENQPGLWAATVLQFAFLVAAFGAMFMVMRRWWSLEVASATDSPQASKAQFSVLNLLLLTAAAAVVMTAVRAARTNVEAGGDYQIVVATVLAFTIFFFNTACAAFAALSPSPPQRNSVLVMCVAALLGVAISLASGQDRVVWWLVAGGSLISVIPTGIVLGSLLVVRLAGYRLVPRRES